jgi:hypothetical protein
VFQIPDRFLDRCEGLSGHILGHIAPALKGGIDAPKPQAAPLQEELGVALALRAMWRVPPSDERAGPRGRAAPTPGDTSPGEKGAAAPL